MHLLMFDSSLPSMTHCQPSSTPGPVRPSSTKPSARLFALDKASDLLGGLNSEGWKNGAGVRPDLSVVAASEALLGFSIFCFSAATLSSEGGLVGVNLRLEKR